MSLLRVAYIAVFSFAAVACFGSVWRAAAITDSDTKRGLVGLLLFSGTWAAASVGRIAAPTPALQLTSYMVGLVVGFASVGAWLYFCSAYAGYSYHRQTTIRQVALTVFLVVVTIKLTNPLHSLYFTASVTTVPFRHLTIDLSVVHWIVTGLSYSLSTIGFYLLYELFRESQFDTTSLGILVSLTAVPAVVDAIAFAEVAPELVLQFNYEPVGVALFAVGVLYVVDEAFVAVPRKWRKEFINQFNDPIVLLTHDGRLRDFNRAAAELFPLEDGTLGDAFETVAPRLCDAAQHPEEIFEIERDGATRFFAVRTMPLVRNDRSAGRALIYKDVTNIERQRRELRRQNDQLNDFSVALNHELRNAITVIQGFVDHSARSLSNDAEFDSDSVTRANNAIVRMQRVISDLSTLARHGQTPETIDDCDLRETVDAARETCQVEELRCTVETDATIAANGPRLEGLFCQAFRFASANGATEVTVDLADGALTITDDGDPLSPKVVEDAFDFGPPSPLGDAEVSLPNIRLLARVHEWTTAIDPSYRDGVRIRIDGVTVRS